MKDKITNFIHRIDKSAVWTVVGILLLFSTSIVVTLISPRYVDPSWTEPSSIYQVQMYEVADPHFYLNAAAKGTDVLQFVHHLKENYSLVAFVEGPKTHIIAPPDLEQYVTRENSPVLKLTSRLLLLRKPSPKSSQNIQGFVGNTVAEHLQQQLQSSWVKENPNWQEKQLAKPYFEILELYSPGEKEAFSLAETDGIFERWVDKDYEILDEKVHQDYHNNAGLIYVKNPVEYRISPYQIGAVKGWRYDPNGQKINSLEELTSPRLGFMSRKELIKLGEHIYAIEGCWYCHTDQSRTLIQDSVLNGSMVYPAPPSSANEYIYNEITFPGTRRIGPDISRVGIKRPSRNWHEAHFWSPKTASAGSIMPSFRHFFDKDPHGASKSSYGVPNDRFEAIYLYLMTKGTRISPPTQAWWRGDDPLHIIRIINGMKPLKNVEEQE
jgi:cytochrome c oxidase cbb3-type subunit 2